MNIKKPKYLGNDTYICCLNYVKGYQPLQLVDKTKQWSIIDLLCYKIILEGFWRLQYVHTFFQNS